MTAATAKKAAEDQVEEPKAEAEAEAPAELANEPAAPEFVEHKTAFAAVVAAKAEVKRVKKGETNHEQKYKFASTDDFLEMVGPIYAKHGLVTIADETGVQYIEKNGRYGPQAWAAITYNITTYHVSGSKLPPVVRHIEVLRNGPQAYGSAQSYVLKQYHRGLLEIPTGDKDDPDFGTVDQGDNGPAQQGQNQRQQNQRQEQPRNGDQKPAQGPRDFARMVEREINAAATLDALRGVLTRHKDGLRRLEQEANDLFNGVIAAKDARKLTLEKMAEAAAAEQARKEAAQSQGGGDQGGNPDAYGQGYGGGQEQGNSRQILDDEIPF